MDTQNQTPSAEVSTSENQATVKATRGRPRKDFTFPTSEFRVATLAKQLNVSVPLVHLKITQAGSDVKVLRKESQGRGRAANVYLYTGPQQASPTPSAPKELVMLSETSYDASEDEQDEVENTIDVQEEELQEA